MNNSRIKNINTAGKFGRYITIFLIIIAISAFVMTAIGTAAAIAVSKQEVNVKVQTNFDVTSNGNIFDKLKNYMSVGDLENIEDLAKYDGQTIKVDDEDISEITVTQIDNGYSVNAKTNEITLTTKNLIGNLVLTLVYIASIIFALFMFRNLMKIMSTCETPFAEDVIKRMTTFANSLVPVAILSMITKGFWDSFNTGNMFNFNIDFGVVLLVAVVYVLVMIFKYGAELQQEADETL